MTTRREILGFFGSLLAGIPMLSLPTKGWAGALDPSGCIEKCAGLFSSFDRVAPIGRRYLAMTPVERDPEVLSSRISERVLGSGARLPAAMSPERFRAKVASVVSQDFESSNVVMIDGWMLSRTEAQICGLVSIDG